MLQDVICPVLASWHSNAAIVITRPANKRGVYFEVLESMAWMKVAFAFSMLPARRPDRIDCRLHSPAFMQFDVPLPSCTPACVDGGALHVGCLVVLATLVHQAILKDVGVCCSGVTTCKQKHLHICVH